MLPLDLFADRSRRLALGVVIVIGAVLSGYVYFISLYLQLVLHFSAVRTGVSLVPATATVMIVSMLLTRRMLPRLGMRRMLLIGLLSLGLGQFWLSHIASGRNYLVDVLGGRLLTAFGLGLALPTATVVVTAGVEPRRQGMAGGLFVACQQIGIAAGLAMLATLAAARTQAFNGSLVAGYRFSFLIGTALTVAAAVFVFFQTRSGRLRNETNSTVVVAHGANAHNDVAPAKLDPERVSQPQKQAKD